MSNKFSKLTRVRGRAARLAAQGVTLPSSPYTPRDVLDAVSAMMEAGGGIPNGSVEMANSLGVMFFFCNLSMMDGPDLVA